MNVCNPRYPSAILADDANRGVTAFMPLAIGVYEDERGQVWILRLNVALRAGCSAAPSPTSWAWRARTWTRSSDPSPPGDHASRADTNATSARVTSSGRSIGLWCPAPSIHRIVAPGIRRAIRSLVPFG